MNYIDLKYLRLLSVHLDKFKDVSTDVFNFRCPICHDSSKDKTKARGYIFVKGDLLLYHCHNCGSPDHRTFYKLLQYVSPTLYDEYKRERFYSKFKPQPNTKTLDDFDLSSNNKIKLNKMGSLKILSDCTLLSKLDESHVAKQYIIGRCIPQNQFSRLYYVDDINLVTKKLDKYKDKDFKKIGAIIIPFIDQDGVINCIQFRFIDKDVKLRYLTIYLNEDKTKAVFGLDVINLDDDIYVCEGPINSMFIDNAIAVAGSKQFNKIQDIFDEMDNITLVFDGDYKTNSHVMSSLESAINKGYKVVLFDNKVNPNDDINDIIKKYKWTRDQLNNYLKSRTFSGLSAKLELSKLLKPVSKKPIYTQNSELMGKLQKTIKG